MSDYLSFRLPESFIETYKEGKLDWKFGIGGGNSLSELTFIGKYSRKKGDGTKEQWFDVCERVINGMYSILKDHCTHQRTPWNEFKALKSAQDAYERMYSFKWLPPGRGLWMMGTDLVHGEGHSNGLQNCSFISTAKLSTHSAWEATGPFIRMMEQAMWGIGCLAEGSIIMTSDGPKPIETLGGACDVIVDGVKHHSPTGSWFTGEKNVVEIRTNEGFRLKLTPDHQVKTVIYRRSTNNVVRCESIWKEAQALLPGDLVALSHAGEYIWGGAGTFDEGYLVGAVLGDGWLDDGGRAFAAAYRKDHNMEGIKRQCEISGQYVPRRNCAGGWRTKNKDCDIYSVGSWVFDYLSKTPKNVKPTVEGTGADFHIGFLRGLFDADGSVIDSGPEGRVVKLTQSNQNTLEVVQRMLLRFGIRSNITVKRAEQVEATILGKVTVSNPAWDLQIGKDGISKFVEMIGFSEGPKSERLLAMGKDRPYRSKQRLHAAVTEVLALDEKMRTYDMSVPDIQTFDANGMQVHNCGSDTRGAGRLILNQPIDRTEIFTVPDSREGWAESVGKLLESFFFKNRPRLEHNYDLIRPAGSPLQRFGGFASGPQPLIDCHESIRAQLEDRAGDHITSRDITDIINKIGKAVQAGGTRRSAQIMFGDPDDKDYVNIKNWELEENVERTGPDGWAWNSNNSVFAETGIEYSDLVENIKINGEPGLFWLELARSYGRMVDPPDGKDWRTVGSNPCAEQTLEHMEVCTLVEMFPSLHNDFDDFKQTIKAAYLYGKAVTLLPTTWPETNEVMARNRRIGCSMSGLAQFVEERGWMQLKTWMDDGYSFLVHRDTKYSEWLAVRESIKKTSIKPSGTVSIVAGVTPGVHWPVKSGYYIRRIRYTIFDPIVDVLKDAGYDVEPSYDDPSNTVVVSFPTRGPVMRDERNVTIWEKVELAVLAQRYWADNQVSATISFMPHEVDQVAHVLSAKDGQLKSISFLPITDAGTSHRQAPYEPIEAFTAEAMMAKIKPISLDRLYGRESLEAQGERFCDTERCELR